MENKLRLSYKTRPINFRPHHKVFNAVCKSTVNLASLRLQPKRTIIQQIQKGAKNEGNQKEAR